MHTYTDIRTKEILRNQAPTSLPGLKTDAGCIVSLVRHTAASIC